MKKYTKTTLKSLYPILVLLLIVVLGFCVRIWQIDRAPKGALIDELHFGYIAQSLLQTGADEHNQKWPLIFKGFGDQKLPAMAYLDILPVALWGLSIFAIRVPSLLIGVASILASYWLLREFSFGKKLSTLGALITALSPWPFFLSRFGFESNIALFCLLVGLASYFRAVRQRNWYWFLLSGVALSLTWYSYIAYRPITALLWIFGLLWLFFIEKIKREHLAVFLFSFLSLIVPFFAPSVIGVNGTRLHQVGIFSDPGLVLKIDESRTFCDMQYPRLLCDAVWNKPVLVSRMLTQRYLAAFSPNYLVSSGEDDLIFLSQDGFGQFYPIVYPFFVIGLVGLFMVGKNMSTHQRLVVLIGLLLSPIPTILSGDPQKVRLSMWYPFVLIVIIFGIKIVLEFAHKRMRNLLLISLSLILAGYSVLYFTEYFAVHTTKNEYYYQSYLPDLHSYLQTLPESTQIHFKPFYSDPIMFYAFYTKLPPKQYQQLAKLGELESSGFQHTVELGRVTASSESLEAVGCKAQQNNQESVYVTDQKIEQANQLYQGKASNGVHTYVYVYDSHSLLTESSCSDN